MMKGAKIKIEGIVQGVGFRPFVYRLASGLGLKGWVLNSTRGVIIEVEGESHNLEVFIRRLKDKSPPMARIEKMLVEDCAPEGYQEFIIKRSSEDEEKFLLVSPDISTCNECREELFHPDNFRFAYPFINCTNCGPRFTIIKDVPYDRPHTTMATFKMCPICQAEYEDPGNRRFHAQPNACSGCGPQLQLRQDGSLCQVTNPLDRTVELLKNGKIVAIKGLGGYHLACDGEDNQVVIRLRSRKIREDKPFAVMCYDLSSVDRYCYLNQGEKELLESPERPILLMRKKTDCPIASAVAPNNRYLGIMLPCTPLHYLLLRQFGHALVMTSGNQSDEPIAYEDEDALRRLSSIADYFLTHNRRIMRRCDDSVARVFAGRSIIIRRSRGYAPRPIRLPGAVNEILACGGELKNTFCLTKNNYAFLSHYIGDLVNLESLASFEEGIQHFRKLFNIHPEIVAYDLHPDYLSTKYAAQLLTINHQLSSVSVQHHHAHIVSCMAENGLRERVIGVAFDGTGYGSDGTIWGGEFLIADYADFKRVGHLQPLPLPGADAAIREPWRMAVSYLYSIYGDNFTDLDLDFNRRLNKRKWPILKQAMDKKVNSSLTSSIGRLFDAVASLLGIRDTINYEGQPAIELEQMAEDRIDEWYPYKIIEEELLLIDPRGMIEAIVEDLKRSNSRPVIAGKFQRTVAEFTLDMCRKISAAEGVNKVVLSGGVFQNIFLLRILWEKLRQEGLEVFIHHQVPTNDGGISLGQAVIANERVKKCA